MPLELLGGPTPGVELFRAIRQGGKAQGASKTVKATAGIVPVDGARAGRFPAIGADRRPDDCLARRGQPHGFFPL